MYPVPREPQWPDVKDCSYPITQKRTQVDLSKNVFGRIIDWLFTRPTFIIVQDYYTYVPSLNKWVFLPYNFVYDYASVPKFFGFLLSPTGILAYGSGPHDFGFRFGGLMLSDGPSDPYEFYVMNQKEIDTVLRSLTDKSSMLPFVSVPVAWVLSTFGSWKPIPMTNINWDKPVLPREFYNKDGTLKSEGRSLRKSLKL